MSTCIKINTFDIGFIKTDMGAINFAEKKRNTSANIRMNSSKKNKNSIGIIIWLC